jgi:hypothetical protein
MLFRGFNVSEGSMGSEFILTLKGEIDRLRNELSNDPRYQKLERLEDVLALYGDDGSNGSNGSDGGDRGELSHRVLTRSISNARAKALELAELLLRNRVGPTPTRQIYEHIVLNGGDIGGRDPVSNLSAMLSNSERFVSNGRAGWTLADVDEEEEETEDFESEEFVIGELLNSLLNSLSLKDIRRLYAEANESHKFPAEFDGAIIAHLQDMGQPEIDDNLIADYRRQLWQELKKHLA